MTSLRRMTRVLLTDKIQTASWIIALYVAAIVISLVPSAFNGELFTRQWSFLLVQHALSWSFVAMLLAFAFLTRTSEGVYTSNKYRLIPISEAKLYTANIFSSFIAFILVFLVQLIFILIYYLFNIRAVKLMLSSNFGGAQTRIWLFVLAIILTGAAGLLFWWAAISLIHLLTTAISRALPANHQKISKLAIYIILIVIVIWMFGKLQNWLSQLAYFQYMFYSSSIYTGPLWSALTMAILALVISVINVWLLKRQVETNQ